MNKVTVKYTVKQIAAMLNESDGAVRWRLNHKGHQPIITYRKKRKFIEYTQEQVDSIIIIETVTFEGKTTMAANDLQPPKYNVGDSVNFYQGRNKFVGTVHLVLPNGDYRVDSAEIGRINLKWFELNLN